MDAFDTMEDISESVGTLLYFLAEGHQTIVSIKARLADARSKKVAFPKRPSLPVYVLLSSIKCLVLRKILVLHSS